MEVLILLWDIKSLRGVLLINYNSQKLEQILLSCSMIHTGTNIFQQAIQLVSLDCSTIQNMTLSRNLSQSNHQSHQSLRQSLLNLKTVLPTFTSEFNLFKQQIIDMSYYIVNKLMNVIKNKNSQITQLNLQLQNSLALNNTMKKQVVQLKQMIAQFMENYKKQIAQKDKLIKQKQQQLHQKNQQVSLKINQINELKNVLKLNFNSPRNTCQNCQQKISNHQTDIIFNSLQNTKENQSNHDFHQSRNKNDEILIEMSESILCHITESGQKLPLQVIQQEPSDINSITDYLQSQRGSQKQNTSKGSTQLLKSSRLNQEDDNQNENFLNYKKFNSLLKNNQNNLKCKQNFDDDDFKLTRKPLCNLKIFTNFQQLKDNDTFSSRVNYKDNQKQLTSIEHERQRRCSQQILTSKNFYHDQNTKNYSTQSNVLIEKNVSNSINVVQTKQQLSLKTQLQQVSKSSSSSELIHLGDTDKINVNLPKMFQTPKNINFVKKNSSRNQIKEQRLKTQPTPRNYKYDSNKQNINFQPQQKPIEMGRKIFARKKMIMTHAKPTNTSRIESKTVKEEIKNFINHKNDESQAMKLKENLIEIKFIESPEKQPSRSSHVLKPSIPTIFSTEISQNGNSRTNHCMDYTSVASNISAINQSAVKSHHLYHSTGKYQSESTPKNSHKITMTPGKPQNRTQQKRSTSKSKEKLKVTSKNHQQSNSSIHHLTSQKKQRFLTEINQNQLITNNQSVTKLKNKNLSVHIGGISKTHLRQNLIDIKRALTNYSLGTFLGNMREVYFDGKTINGQKQGFGKVIYDNGMNYEGQFKQGKKTGTSKITLNGIDIFEGNFSNDIIDGQGYLKFLRFFANPNQSSKILHDASYFGRFCQNKFDGMGTLFLNQKQKIVTKFLNGIPVGQLTFYSENDILFSIWPQI